MTHEEARLLWASALEELKLQMARATFDAWLRGSRVVELGEGALKVEVRHAHNVDWLQHRLRQTVERTVSRLAGRPVAVTFVAALPDPEQTEASDGAEILPAEDGSRSRAGRRKRSPGSEQPPPPRAAAAARELTSTDYYIRIKTAFRRRALGELSGPEVKVFLCIALHLGSNGTSQPGLETMMKETSLSRSAACSAIARLISLGLMSKEVGYRRKTIYRIKGYAWFGPKPAPALWEEADEDKDKDD